MNQLLVIETVEQLNAPAVFKNKDAVQEIIDKIKAEVTSFVPDVSTSTGRKEIASLAYKVARSKTALDKMGKSLVDGIKQQAKVIDESRKLVRDQLDALNDQIRKPLTDWENAEKSRIEKHKVNLQTINSYKTVEIASWPDNKIVVSNEYKLALAELEGVAIDESWEEFKAEAAIAKDQAITALKLKIAEAEKREAEAAELERLRREAAEREAREAAERQAREEAERKAYEEIERKAREERIRREAEERVRAEEQRKIESEKAAREMEKIQAERRVAEAEKKAAEAELRAREAAERERQKIAEAERQEQIEAERRERNKAHKSKILNDAVSDLCAEGIDVTEAKMAVKAIAQGKVRNVTVTF